MPAGPTWPAEKSAPSATFPRPNESSRLHESSYVCDPPCARNGQGFQNPSHKCHSGCSHGALSPFSPGGAPTRRRLATAWQAERGGYSLREIAQQHGPFEYFNSLLTRLMATVRRSKDRRYCLLQARPAGAITRSLARLAQLIAEFPTQGATLVCTSQGIDPTNQIPRVAFFATGL